MLKKYVLNWKRNWVLESESDKILTSGCRIRLRA